MSVSQDISTVYLTTTDAVKHNVATFRVDGNEGDMICVNMDVAGTNNAGNAILSAVRALYVFHNGALAFVGHTKLTTISDSVSSHWLVSAEADATDPQQLNLTCTGQAGQTIRWTVFGDWEVLPGNV